MKLLITGASGYIGSRLIATLAASSEHTIYALVRSKKRFKIPKRIAEKVHTIEGDLLKEDTLDNIPHDIDVAFYLVHSMSQKGESFSSLEERCAGNFVACLKKRSAKQIIYLSGLANDQKLSKHLNSRLNVENILKNSGIPCTIFRAGIIIGSGSASFEIIRDLVEKLPFMIAPKWVNNLCQPISIEDVLFYLIQSIGKEKSFNKTFDIGGKDLLSYKEMMLGYAEERDLKRWIVTVPVLTPRLSSYWLYFVTQTNFHLAKSLVDSLKNEVVCKDRKFEEFFPRECLGYREAVQHTLMNKTPQYTFPSWKDALLNSALNPNLEVYTPVPNEGCFVEIVRIPFTISQELVTNTLFAIGGRNGWYAMNWAWKLRGYMDKLFGGVGLGRGRTDQQRLSPGDSLDFWRVIAADRQKGSLLLYAEMRLPGEAWLSWTIENEESGEKTLIQNATFRPKGLFGRIYWYSLYPIHHFIFKRMAQNILKKAQAK